MRIGKVIPPYAIDGLEVENYSSSANNTRTNNMNKGIDSALSMIPEESKSVQDSRN